jgi:hypothetical protein
MHIRDAEELFELVDFGTPVEVVYEPVVFEKEGNLLTLTVFPDGMGRGMPSAKQALEQILKRYPEADIDEGRIAEALSQPLGKPVPIGKMILTIRVEKQANNDGE